MILGGLLVHVLLGSAVSAQRVRDERKLHLPDLRLDRPLLFDADRDGDLDAAIGGSQVRLLLNLGRLRFADVTPPTMPVLSATPLAAADLDGDGDADLFTSGPQLLLNDRGTFSLASVGRLPLLSNVTAGFALGDVDGDADLDAFVAGWSQSWILRNSGTATFTAVPLHPAANNAASARFGDVDRDRDLDLVVTGADATVVLANDGTGQFTPIAGALPALSSANFVLADFDRDGDLDLASGHYWLVPRQLFLNDGQGRFVEATATHLPPGAAGSNRGIEAQDIDADGDVDLIVARDYDSELLLNDGTGRFVLGDAGDLRTLRSPQLAVGDLDGNGTIDLLTQPTHVLIGRRRGAFALVDAAALEADADSVIAIADFTGEGDLDVLHLFSSLQYVLKRNDGTGAFPAAHYAYLPSLRLSNGATTAAGDVDGDGDLDVVRSSWDFYPPCRGLSVLRNGGAGTFAPPTRWQSPDNGTPSALYLDDVDVDGDLDALDVGSSSVLLVLNDGQGNFTQASLIVPAYRPQCDLFDYDGDGDRDLFVASDRLRLHENQQGRYVDVTARRFATAPAGGTPRLARVNGRAWLFVFTNQTLVYEGGSGGFTARPDLTYNGASSSARVVPSLGSLTAVDLVLSGATVRVLRFDGYRISDVTQEVLGTAQYIDVQHAGDLDGDGDVDWLGVRGEQDHRVLRGTLRSFAAPFAAIGGSDFEYRITDAMAGGTPTVVSLLLSTQIIRFPVPGVGILRVDPQSAFVLPPFALRTSAPTSITFRVPVDAALRDVPLVAQPWVIYPARASSMLGGAVRELIR